MSGHTFRHPDLYQQLPFRDWIRAEMPAGPAGFIAEDLDLVVRTFGAVNGTDAAGRVMLIEIKHGSAQMNRSKQMTFGLLDALLRQADPVGARYRGFYLVRTDDPDWSQAPAFMVNGHSLTPEQFKGWLRGEQCVQPYTFPPLQLRAVRPEPFPVAQ